jgi:hypothetical protein
MARACLAIAKYAAYGIEVGVTAGEKPFEIRFGRCLQPGVFARPAANTEAFNIRVGRRVAH